MKLWGNIASEEKKEKQLGFVCNNSLRWIPGIYVLFHRIVTNSRDEWKGKREMEPVECDVIHTTDGIMD